MPTKPGPHSSIDIAFLDIEMPGAAGLEISSGLTAALAAIVFVTAFSRYALPAFDVAAVDYMLKPFSDERLFSAVERAKMRVRERRLGELASQMVSVSAELKGADPTAAGYLTRLPYRESDRSLFIKTSDLRNHQLVGKLVSSAVHARAHKSTSVLAT